MLLCTRHCSTSLDRTKWERAKWEWSAPERSCGRALECCRAAACASDPRRLVAILRARFSAGVFGALSVRSAARRCGGGDACRHTPRGAWACAPHLACCAGVASCILHLACCAGVASCILRVASWSAASSPHYHAANIAQAAHDAFLVRMQACRVARHATCRSHQAACNACPAACNGRRASVQQA